MLYVGTAATSVLRTTHTLYRGGSEDGYLHLYIDSIIDSIKN